MSGIPVKAKLTFNEMQFGLLVATPVLTGSFVRAPGVLWLLCLPGRGVFIAGPNGTRNRSSATERSGFVPYTMYRTGHQAMNDTTCRKLLSITLSDVCVQLERAIEWRRAQNRALMHLMTSLRYLKEGRLATNPGFDADLEAVEARGSETKSWTIVLRTGERCQLDVCFITEDMMPAFIRVMRCRAVPELSVAEDRNTVSDDEIDAIRTSIRNRINEFDWLNREDFENMRLLALRSDDCRSEVLYQTSDLADCPL